MSVGYLFPFVLAIVACANEQFDGLPRGGPVQKVESKTPGPQVIVYHFDNPGKVPIPRPEIYTDCGCITESFEPDTIPPNGTAKLVFVTELRRQAVDVHSVKLRWQSGLETMLVFSITADRVPGLYVAPERLILSAIRNRDSVVVSFMAEYGVGGDVPKLFAVQAHNGLHIRCNLLNTSRELPGAVMGELQLFVSDLTPSEALRIQATGLPNATILLER